MPAVLPEAGGRRWVCLGLGTEPFGIGSPLRLQSGPTPTPSCLTVVGWIWKVVFLKKKKGYTREKKQSFVG